MIALLILAAGSSSRMRGRDKLMEDIDGVPLLRRTAMRACAAGGTTLVTLPPAPHPRYEALSGLDVTPVSVRGAAEGMNASLRAGLAALPQKAQAVMVLLADMPDLTTDDLRTVLDAVDMTTGTRIWRATTEDGLPGHPIVFHHALLPALLALEGETGGSGVVKAHAHQTRYIALPHARARTDLDTPEAWAAWRAT